MAQTPEKKLLAITRGEAAVQLWSKGDGPRVLALHGWLDNSSSFGPLADRLENVQLAAPDFLGHGESSHLSAGMYYHFVDWVWDTLNVADSLGWDEFILIGHSLGGAVATLIAGTVPERVKGLFLIESIGPFAHRAEDAPEKLAHHVQELKKLPQKKMPTYPSFEAAVAARRKAGQLTLEGATHLANRATRTEDGRVTWRSDPRLKIPSPFRMTEDQVRAFLDQIKCPTTAIRATDGLPMDPLAIKARAKCIKHLNLVELSGGHHLHLDYPDRVAPLVQEFLKSVLPKK